MSQTVLPTVTKAWHGTNNNADAACRVVLQLAVGTNATTECKRCFLSCTWRLQQLTVKDLLQTARRVRCGSSST